MKHKTWFRLIMKAIGVLLIGLSLPSLGQAIGFVVQIAYNYGTAATPYDIFYWPAHVSYYVGGVLQAVLGLYLLFGGAWLVNKCIPSNRPYCPDCGYELRTSRGERCPECGAMLPADATPCDPST